jgi:hypothetical protein
MIWIWNFNYFQEAVVMGSGTRYHKSAYVHMLSEITQGKYDQAKAKSPKPSATLGSE